MNKIFKKWTKNLCKKYTLKKWTYRTSFDRFLLGGVTRMQQGNLLTTPLHMYNLLALYPSVLAQSSMSFHRYRPSAIWLTSDGFTKDFTSSRTCTVATINSNRLEWGFINAYLKFYNVKTTIFNVNYASVKHSKQPIACPFGFAFILQVNGYKCWMKAFILLKFRN